MTSQTELSGKARKDNTARPNARAARRKPKITPNQADATLSAVGVLRIFTKFSKNSIILINLAFIFDLPRVSDYYENIL